MEWKCFKHRPRLSLAHNWTSLLHEMLQYVNKSITLRFLYTPFYYFYNSYLFFSLCFSLSKGQLVCFPSEGERNFLTWRKRSGTDTNMVCLWHKLHSNLLFLHLFFVYFLLPPFFPLSTSLPVEHVRHIGGGCLEACVHALSTMHVCKWNHLLYLFIMWRGLTAYLCN